MKTPIHVSKANAPAPYLETTARKGLVLIVPYFSRGAVKTDWAFPKRGDDCDWVRLLSCDKDGDIILDAAYAWADEKADADQAERLNRGKEALLKAWKESGPRSAAEFPAPAPTTLVWAEEEYKGNQMFKVILPRADGLGGDFVANMGLKKWVALLGCDEEGQSMLWTGFLHALEALPAERERLVASMALLVRKLSEGAEEVEFQEEMEKGAEVEEALPPSLLDRIYQAIAASCSGDEDISEDLDTAIYELLRIRAKLAGEDNEFASNVCDSLICQWK